MWWWQFSSQIFFLLLLAQLCYFPETYLLKMVCFLKLPRGGLAPWEPQLPCHFPLFSSAYWLRFIQTLWPSLSVCSFSSMTHNQINVLGFLVHTILYYILYRDVSIFGLNFLFLFFFWLSYVWILDMNHFPKKKKKKKKLETKRRRIVVNAYTRHRQVVPYPSLSHTQDHSALKNSQHFSLALLSFHLSQN